MTEEERSERFLLPLFDGSNFPAWKFRMRVLLEEYDLLQCIETEAAEVNDLKAETSDTEAIKKAKAEKREKRSKQDRRCKSLLVSRIHDSQLEYVQEKGTPKQIWDALVRVFERKSIASRMHLKRQMLSLRFDAGSLQEHFLTFDRLVRDYRNTGAVIEELDVICHLLLTLGPKFSTVVTAIETMPEDKLTLEFVRCRLLDEEIKRKGSGVELFTSSVDAAAFAGSQKKNKKKKKFKCFGCQQEGHKLSECPKKKIPERGKYQSKANLADRGGVSFVALNSECRRDEQFSDRQQVEWFVDYGCSDHHVKDRELFDDLKPLAKPVQIAVAKNDESIVATHSGTVKLFCIVGVVKVESKGMRVVFNNGEVKIYRGSEILVSGSRYGKLYKLDMYTSEECESEAMLSCGRISKNLHLWHRRLGHLNANQLGQLINKRMVDGMLPATQSVDKSEITCEPCILGKQARKPFPARDGKRSSRVLEVIHSDLCGPVTPTGLNGERYFISFVDDWSHFAMIFPMRSKREALECFKYYEAVVTAKFGQRISRFKCDNGGEYANKAFVGFCEVKGIQIEWTVPYTPQQNGTSERLNRTVVERARAMLEDTNIGKQFWVQAVQTAVYLVNRCPTNANDMNATPFEIWEGKCPNISKLRVFGCTVYVHVPSEIRKKLDAKAWKGLFVGYSPNGYRVWNPATRSIVVARDVDFVELPEELPVSEKMKKKKNNPVIFVRKDKPEQEENEEQSDGEEEESEEQVDGVEEEDEEQFSSFQEEGSDEIENAVNVDPNVRPVRVRGAPGWHKDYEVDANFALNALSYVDNLPDSVSEMQKREDWCLWQKAMQEEMDALVKNGTWTLAELPKGRSAVSCKWIFKIKHADEDQPPRYKARLVARGFTQKPGFDFSETYSPVARMDTLRTVLALANQEGMTVQQMDVKTAFLNGNLTEEIYMLQPEGFHQQQGLVCRLNKSLYGLKQASRSWNIRFHTFIERLGFQRSANDLCLYCRGTGKQMVLIVLYVDNILIVSPSEKVVRTIKRSLAREFEMTDQGAVKHFLGITIDRDVEKKVMCIHQRRYLENLLVRFEMQNCRAVSTPIENKLKLPKGEESKRISKPYRELVGCIMYVALTTRPDLAVAANYFSQFQVCPNEEHWIHLRRVLRYIQGTLSLGLCYRASNDSPLLEVYTDADWASDITDRRSVSGAVFKVFGATVNWHSKKQPTVSLSSTEAELVALCTAACHCQWLVRLLGDLGRFTDGPVLFHEDNQSTIKIASSPKDSSRLKHMDVKYFYVRELLERSLIKIEYVPSSMQQADILTKGMPAPGFKKLRDSLGMKDCNV